MGLLKIILCLLGSHNWEIKKWVRFKDIKCKHISEEGFDRTCQRCNKIQRLQRPKKYHPIKYVWTNLN